jgi:hypothetical protein
MVLAIMQKNEFIKSHGLGNDYIVPDPDALSFELTPAAIGRICDRDHRDSDRKKTKLAERDEFEPPDDLANGQ